ncbi:BTB/POZ domain-containing protein 19 isoform X4 [Arvicanthis niloticus]|uniref:BTB/POZ domain-containing protein 19 isoform X4 n=1 Tax=Arvicanthis niloticus TaxID=61156 RepID=UPI00402BCB01
MENSGLVVHGQSAPFSTALRSLVNNPWHSDICFVVGQERQEVFAHRCLLACRCNFFQRLLGPGVPSPVVLSTVPAEAFLAVLEFLYTNSVKLHRHSVLEVLTAAVEYGLEELGELCLEFVVKVLDVELVCEALQAVLDQPVAEVAAPVVRELRLALLAPAELSALEEQNRREPFIPVWTPVTELRSILPRGDEEQGPGTSVSVVTRFPLQVEQIVEAWKCHALQRGDAARSAPCRRRRGTLPRDHHRFLDFRFK